MGTDGQDTASDPRDEASETVMDLLREHVPLTLLIDLSRGDGISSTEIARVEGGNADWLLPHGRS